ncbi:MAG: MGMT family protein [Flavobacteriia bacterium]|nr:MGMT family protein [Flavobacteriia bacterium]OJX36080.1 MAG: cysteine methyltransferase [Flavobacteriia bacterium 40-80]
MKLSEKNKDFFEMVFQVVQLIPPGRVTSYGAIARYLGSPQSSRMVGWAMHASHQVPGIPAHRVVNRIGLLTGRIHFDPPEMMEKRLQQEGISVKNDAVVDFKKIFWDPNVELEIK